MWIVRSFLRGDMTQLLEALYKRMVTRDRFDASIRMNEVGATVTNMGNRNLLPHDEGGGEGCSAAGCFLLDGALRVANGSLHDLLKGFFHRVRFDMEEVGMKFLNDISGN